jgi:broad specificity phosphatase PhoE
VSDTGNATTPVITRLVLVRHGESVSNVSRTFGGPRTCTGLSDAGRWQSERLARRLRLTGELAGTVLYASAYPRAMETAKLIAPALGDPELIIDERFGELDPGEDIDGMLWDDIVARYAPNWDDEDADAVLFPGGETIGQLHRRVVAAIDDLLEEHPGGLITVCTHGGVVDAAMRIAMRVPPRGWIELFATHTALTVLSSSASGRWRVDRYNDAAHLLDGFFA